MMNFWQSLIYGLIQGITEFLPISSSAHLALLPKFLNFDDPGAIFDLALHVGTALSILIYFRLEVSHIFQDCRRIILKKGIQLNGREIFSLHLVIATFVTVFIALLIKDFALMYGRSSVIIGWNFIIFGVLMALADWFCPSKPAPVMEEKNYWRAMLIGFSQVVALFPGVSRSGATLTMGRAIGLSRVEATRFSFLLSLPLILGGVLLEYRFIAQEKTVFSFSSVVIGISVSFVVSYLVIHYFLKFVSQMGLWPFALYRLLFGAFILWAY
jgi:undecaprenyl-diphosphatase